MSFSVTSLSQLMAAIGGLGTAAYGLVDASKAFAGGMSNPGFGFVRSAVEPLLVDAKGPGKSKILATLRANWLNGVAKADQKATARSLIHLGLTEANAPQLAGATGLDADLLKTAAANARSVNAAGGGTARNVTPQDMNVLGEFDVVVSATLDQAYERADQYYRNCAKLAATGVAMLLALLGGAIGQAAGYWGSSHMWAALLVGTLATPVAPVAKDLSTSLAAAVKAVGSLKR